MAPWQARLPIYQEDPDWCGHAMISLRTWACADCDRPVTPATRARMEHEPTRAPAGSVWVLLYGHQEEVREGCIRGAVDGLFSDRAIIARRLIQQSYVGADDIRDVMRRTHWYQGAQNPTCFEGWEEEADAAGNTHAYRLDLEKIDL